MKKTHIFDGKAYFCIASTSFALGMSFTLRSLSVLCYVCIRFLFCFSCRMSERACDQSMLMLISYKLYDIITAINLKLYEKSSQVSKESTHSEWPLINFEEYDFIH